MYFFIPCIFHSDFTRQLFLAYGCLYFCSSLFLAFDSYCHFSFFLQSNVLLPRQDFPFDFFLSVLYLECLAFSFCNSNFFTA